jgi:hypothetical protein
LLLDARADVRARQMATIAQRYDSGTGALVEALAANVAELHPMLRLPLASLAFPALRRRPRPQLKGFIEAMQALIDADGRVALDEYCLATLIRLQVIEALSPASVRVIGRVKLPQASADIAALIAIVAKYGHDDEIAAQRAYLSAMNESLPSATLPYSAPSDWAGALDRALAKLDLLAPAGKEVIVRGLTRAISEDGKVSVAESEMLRTICAALHCPLPPLLSNGP